MPHRRTSPLAFILVVLLISLAEIAGNSPSHSHARAAPVEVAAPTAYPAFVFSGRCASLDAPPRFTLANVPVTTLFAGAAAPVRAPREPDVLPVELAELLAEPHAIVIRARPGDAADALACGEISGQEEGTLAIGLQEQGGSGYAGLARLRDDGERTRLTTFLTEGLAGTASARKSAWALAEAPGCGCAAAHDPSAMAVTVAVLDARFVPASFQVPAGATVTWVNVGRADHTVTLFRVGRLVADSDALAVGRSFAQTFREPGTYDYLSTSDAAMRGRIVVTRGG